MVTLLVRSFLFNSCHVDWGWLWWSYDFNLSILPLVRENICFMYTLLYTLCIYTALCIYAMYITLCIYTIMYIHCYTHLYSPGLQTVHSVLPVPSAIDPAAQSIQVLDPVSFLQERTLREMWSNSDAFNLGTGKRLGAAFGYRGALDFSLS